MGLNLATKNLPAKLHAKGVVYPKQPVSPDEQLANRRTTAHDREVSSDFGQSSALPLVFDQQDFKKLFEFSEWTN